MRWLILLSPLFSFPAPSFAKGDSLPSPRIFHFFQKKSKTEKAVIQKMSDEQLTNLVDRMLDASRIAPDLWEEVSLEIARRNIRRIHNENKSEYILLRLNLTSVPELFIAKPKPDSVSPFALSENCFYPAANYYPENSGWNGDLSVLFKEEFPPDTSFIIEFENNEFGCFSLPAWGPVSSSFGWRG